MCGFFILYGEKLHESSDFEGAFNKAGDSETEEGLRVREVTRESLGGCFGSPGSQRKRGPWRLDQG